MQQNTKKCWRTEELVFCGSTEFANAILSAQLSENEISLY